MSYQRLIDLNTLLRQDPAPSLVSVNDERQRLERLEADLEEVKTKFKRYAPDWPLRSAVLGRLDTMLDRVIADSRRIVDYINRAEQSGRLTMEQQRAQERQEREHERLQRQKEDLDRLKIAKELAAVEKQRWEAESKRVTTRRVTESPRYRYEQSGYIPM